MSGAQVVTVVAEQLLDAIEAMRGSTEAHSWVAEATAPAQVASTLQHLTCCHACHAWPPTFPHANV